MIFNWRGATSEESLPYCFGCKVKGLHSCTKIPLHQYLRPAGIPATPGTLTLTFLPLLSLDVNTG